MVFQMKPSKMYHVPQRLQLGKLRVRAGPQGTDPETGGLCLCPQPRQSCP